MRSTAGATTRDKPGPPAKGAFSSEGLKEKLKDVVECESEQQSSQPCVVEEFFWIGNSIVAFSKWRLGYMGKLSQIHWVELDWLVKNESQLQHFYLNKISPEPADCRDGATRFPL